MNAGPVIARPLVIAVCLVVGCGPGSQDTASLEVHDAQILLDGSNDPTEDTPNAVDATPAALDAPEDVPTLPDVGPEDAFDRMEPDASEPDAPPVDLVDDTGSDLVEADTFVDVGPELPSVVPLPSLFHVQVDSGRNQDDPSPLGLAPLSDGGLLVAGGRWIARFSGAGKLVWHRLRPRSYGEIVNVYGAAGGDAGMVMLESVREFTDGPSVDRVVVYSLDGDVLWKKSCEALAGVPCDIPFVSAPPVAIDDHRFALIVEDEVGPRWLSFAITGEAVASGSITGTVVYGLRLVGGGGQFAVLRDAGEGVRSEVFSATGQVVSTHILEGSSSAAAFAPDGAFVLKTRVASPIPSLVARIYRIDSFGAVAVRDLDAEEDFQALEIAPTGDIFTVGRQPGDPSGPRVRTRWSPDWNVVETVEEPGEHWSIGRIAWRNGVLYDSGDAPAFPENPTGQTDMMLRATRWPGQPGVEPASTRVQLTEPLGESEIGPRCGEGTPCFDVCGRPTHLEPIPPPLGMSLGPGSTTYLWAQFLTDDPTFIPGGYVIGTGSDSVAWTEPLRDGHWSSTGMRRRDHLLTIDTPGMLAVVDGSSPTAPTLIACVPDPEYDPYLWYVHGPVAVTGRFLLTGDGYYDLESVAPNQAMYFNGTLLAAWMGRALLDTGDPNALTVFDFSGEAAPTISMSPGAPIAVHWEIADLGVTYATQPGEAIGAIDLASQDLHRYLGVVGDCWLDLEPVIAGAGVAMRVDLRTRTRLAAESPIICPPFEGSAFVIPDATGLHRVVLKYTSAGGPPELLVADAAPIAVGVLWDEFIWVGDQLIRNRYSSKTLSVLVRLEPDTGKILEAIDAGNHAFSLLGTDGERLYLRSGGGIHSVGRDENMLRLLPMPPGFSKPTLIAAPGALYLMEHGTLVRMTADGTVLATAAAELLLLPNDYLYFGPQPADAYATDLGVFMVDELQNIHWYAAENLQHRIASSSKHFRPRGGHHGRLFGLRDSPGGIYVGSATTLAVFQPVVVDADTFDLNLIADSGHLAAGVTAATAAPNGSVFWAIESDRTIELRLDPVLVPQP